MRSEEQSLVRVSQKWGGTYDKNEINVLCVLGYWKTIVFLCVKTMGCRVVMRDEAEKFTSAKKTFSYQVKCNNWTCAEPVAM